MTGVRSVFVSFLVENCPLLFYKDHVECKMIKGFYCPEEDSTITVPPTSTHKNHTS